MQKEQKKIAHTSTSGSGTQVMSENKIQVPAAHAS